MGKFKKGDKVMDNGKKSGHTYPEVGTIIEVSPPDSWLWYRVQFPGKPVEEFHKGELKLVTKGLVKKKPIIKKKINIYNETSNIIRKDIDNFPMKFAFNNEQLEEGLKELGATKKDVINIGGGGFIRRTDKAKYLAMIKKHNKLHSDGLKNPTYVYQMFRYELSNHEYGVNEDEYDTLQSVGLTSKQVANNPMWAKQLDKAKEDYMKMFWENE